MPVKRRKLSELYGILPAKGRPLTMARAREIAAKKLAAEYLRKNRPR